MCGAFCVCRAQPLRNPPAFKTLYIIVVQAPMTKDQIKRDTFVESHPRAGAFSEEVRREGEKFATNKHKFGHKNAWESVKSVAKNLHPILPAICGIKTGWGAIPNLPSSPVFHLRSPVGFFTKICVISVYLRPIPSAVLPPGTPPADRSPSRQAPLPPPP